MPEQNIGSAKEAKSIYLTIVYGPEWKTFNRVMDNRDRAIFIFIYVAWLSFSFSLALGVYAYFAWSKNGACLYFGCLIMVYLSVYMSVCKFAGLLVSSI